MTKPTKEGRWHRTEDGRRIRYFNGFGPRDYLHPEAGISPAALAEAADWYRRWNAMDHEESEEQMKQIRQELLKEIQPWLNRMKKRQAEREMGQTSFLD